MLLDQDLDELREWTLKLQEALRGVKGIEDVSSDQDRPGPQANVTIDRDAASRLGVPVSAIDSALSNAYSQRQVSIIYTQRNQYRVVLETTARPAGRPGAARPALCAGRRDGQQVPITSVVRLDRATAPLAVRHQGQFPSASISFNLLPGTSQGDAITLVTEAARNLRMPEGVRTEFAGNAKFLQQSLSTQPFLIGAALSSRSTSCSACCTKACCIR